jgi:hydroxymethylbilane synthase
VSAAPAGAGTLRIGTRGSALALAQARQTEALLRARWPALRIEVQVITTTGDVRTDVPLAEIGGRGVFAAEIEHALARGEVDVAVHSSKDLPSTLAAEFALGAFLPREDPRDVLCTRGPRLEELPHGALVGTSSPRRACQLRARRPDLRVEDIRGNVDTRLRKLDEGQYDAILLAAAGLHRLGLAHRITEYLAPEVMLPQVGQGAVGLEVRAGDARALAHVAPLDDPRTRLAVEAERAFLARLGAGCTAPAGAHASLADDGATLVVEGMIGAPDGSRVVRLAREGSAAEGPTLGAQVAEALMADGGLELMRAAGARAGVA